VNIQLRKFNFKSYLIEAWGLGMFMISACLFATVLEYPLSPVHEYISNAFVRLVLMGVAMGLTAYGILTSPWGKISGAHINPAVTLVHYRLGKITLHDTVGYIVFQTIGGTLAVYIMQMLLGNALTGKPVECVVTIPFCGHEIHALIMELCIAFILMMTVQIISNSTLANHTAKFAGTLVMLNVIVAGPVSGFGMNPARTFASALPAHRWDSYWIYLFAPITGMLAATEMYLQVKKYLKRKNAMMEERFQ
jgi:aquaporin Z